MTTLDVVSWKQKSDSAGEGTAVKELVHLARVQGLSLTGPDGLGKQFTRTVLGTVLNQELTEHLGREKNRAPDGRELINVGNGTRSKIVLTQATDNVQIEVPGDRDGSFEPVIVKKCAFWLNLWSASIQRDDLPAQKMIRGVGHQGEEPVVKPAVGRSGCGDRSELG